MKLLLMLVHNHCMLDHFSKSRGWFARKKNLLPTSSPDSQRLEAWRIGTFSYFRFGSKP